MTAAVPYPFADLADCKPEKTSNGPRRGGSASEAGSSDQSPHAMRFTVFGPTSSKEEEPPLVHTAEDLARAVEDARRTTALEVETEIRSTMTDEIEQRRCDMLAAINEQLGLHKSAYEQELVHLAGASQRFAILLARAIVPRAVDRCPLVDITEPLKSTLARLVTEPSMEMRLPPDLFEEGTKLMADLAEEVGFKGELTIVADPSLGKGDARLRWRGGRIDRHLDCLEQEVLELVDRWLEEPVEADDDGPPKPCMISEPQEASIGDDAPDKANDTTPAGE